MQSLATGAGWAEAAGSPCLDREPVRNCAGSSDRRQPLDFSIVDWRWFIAGAVAIGVGLLVWWTAFVLVPVGVLLISFGVLRAIRGHARSD